MSTITLAANTAPAALVGRSFTSAIGTFRVVQAWHASTFAGMGMMVEVERSAGTRGGRSAYGAQYGQLFGVVGD